MSRTIIKIPYSDFQKANAVIRNTLLSHGYKERFNKGTLYWQKGNGFFAAPKCFQFNFSETEITVSAWLSGFGLESDLTGVIGIVPKRQMTEILQLLKMNIPRA